MKAEIDNLNKTDEQLLIVCIKNSAYFKQAMLKAFKHGIEFEQIDSDVDINVDTCDDINLPFHEWFAKHYLNIDSTSIITGTNETCSKVYNNYFDIFKYNALCARATLFPGKSIDEVQEILNKM